MAYENDRLTAKVVVTIFPCTKTYRINKYSLMRVFWYVASVFPDDVDGRRLILRGLLMLEDAGTTVLLKCRGDNPINTILRYLRLESVT